MRNALQKYFIWRSKYYSTTHTKSTSAKDLREGNKKECTILINHLCNHLCLKIKSYFKHLIDNYLGRAGVENDWSS